MNLSIIIPVCNEAKTIADCLGSILSQLTRKQEVQLADYGSDDGTMEVVATFHDARLRVVGPAGSYAEALNRLMEEARGEYVVRINADCIMSPGRLRRQLRFMNLHPEVALAGGFVELHGARTFVRKVPSKVSDMALLESCCIFPETTILRRSVALCLGLHYREEHRQWADYAFYCELAKKGKVLCNQELVMAERQADSGASSLQGDEDIEEGIRLDMARWIKQREDEVKADYRTLPRSGNRLSVVISFLNEKEEVGRTVRSIRETAGHRVDIIVINDHSDDGYDYEADLEGLDVHYFVNSYRIGAAAGKEKAVQISSTPYFILLDAHMRFYDTNWPERIIEELDKNPNQLLCCQTRMLVKQKNGLVKDKGEMGVFGAYVDFTTKGYTPCIQWNTKNIVSCLKEGQIPAVLGASYCSSKAYWNRLKGLQGLIHYGSEEPYISIKAWMEGGGCRLVEDVVIGHIYRDKAPYLLVGLPHLFNYVVIILTLYPTSERGKAQAAIIKANPSLYKRLSVMTAVHARDIESLRREYRALFRVHDFGYIRKINRIVLNEELLLIREEQDRIADIIRLIEVLPPSSDAKGLFNGMAGEMIALAHYARRHQDRAADEAASHLLSLLIGEVDNRSLPFSLADGLCGIGWAFCYLIHHHFIRELPGDTLQKIDARVMEWDVLRLRDTGMATGLGGVLAYAVLRLGISADAFDATYKEHLLEAAQNIVAHPDCERRTLAFALQLLEGLAQNDTAMLSVHLEDVTDLPIFLPKDIQLRKRGLQGQAGFVLYLMDRQTIRENYVSTKTNP